jgi:hypothetical protein
VQLPFNLFDVTVWIAFMAVMLLITSELVYIYSHGLGFAITKNVYVLRYWHGLVFAGTGSTFDDYAVNILGNLYQCFFVCSNLRLG